MPFKDIFKRQVESLFSTEAARRNPSLVQDLRDEFDRVVGDTIDPGRHEREEARRAAHLEETRTQSGLDQPVTIEGIAGEWEAVELFHFDDGTAAFALVDRRTVETAQLSPVDEGTVVLDSPHDQHSATVPGAFWRTDTQVGFRLDGAELRSDGVRPIRITCDLRADVPPDETAYEDFAQRASPRR